MASKTKAKSRGAAKARDAKKDNESHAWKYLLWVLLAGVWLLVAASLLSHDPADPLAYDETGRAVGHAEGVTNGGYHNWVGRVGALVSHELLTVVGPGIWLAMLAAGAWLGMAALGRKLGQPVLRIVGTALMAAAASALVGLLGPVVVAGYEAGPEGPGGLLATWINDELTPRFATPGTAVILGVLFLAGALLTADRVVLAVPRALGLAIAKAAGVRPPAWLRNLSIPRPALPRFGRRGEPVHVQDDLDDRRHIPVRSNGKTRDDDEIDEDAGGFAGTRSWGQTDDDDDAPRRKGRGKGKRKAQAREEDPDAERVDDEADREAQAYEPDRATDEADAPGAYLEDKQDKLSPQAIREKMRQMPINFAPELSKNKAAAPPPEIDLSGYQFPGMDILEEPETNFNEEMEKIVRDQAVELESALQQYHIDGEVVGIDSGPVITLFEVRLAPGTKVARLNNINSDLARALKAQNIRIVPNMAGKDTVGIEVPNQRKERVRLKELMTCDPEAIDKMKLPMFLGKDASGNPLIQDLNAMPHMLIAGTTGSGKSVCMNSIIMSLLFTKRPDEVKMVLVDPKMVEMAMFRDVPHLMCPVVTEMSKAAAILEWAVTKMDERYELLAEAGVRDIASYNELGEEELRERLDPATEEEFARTPKKLPYLVFIIDELADLMMTNKEVEHSIVRIAQKARAVGIHLILATQRPQANVVTGLIKSNMPCRIAMKVASGMDSRIVLDQKGGELLMGHGDMLFLSPRSSKLFRAQGTLVDDAEIRKTVKFLKEIASQHFEPQLVQIKSPDQKDVDEEAQNDPLFNDAVEVVLDSKRGSVSLLQRRLTIGYARASRLIESMAAAGILGDHKTAQAREVNLTREEWDAMRAAAAEEAEDAEDAEDVEEREEDASDDGDEQQELAYESEEDAYDEEEDFDEDEDEETEDDEADEVAEDDDAYEEDEEEYEEEESEDNRRT
ncbi:MAG: DNA translocase FtsK 4TM domain-containing protein [Phycisphaeraceae bacterium]